VPPQQRSFVKDDQGFVVQEQLRPGEHLPGDRAAGSVGRCLVRRHFLTVSLRTDPSVREIVSVAESGGVRTVSHLGEGCGVRPAYRGRPMLPARERALRLISAPPWSTASAVIWRAVGLYRTESCEVP
jgi:hypothetical protein